MLIVIPRATTEKSLKKYGKRNHKGIKVVQRKYIFNTKEFSNGGVEAQKDTKYVENK